MTLPRRRFLQQAGIGLAGAAGLSAVGANVSSILQLARAADESDRHYVFAYFDGGWDTLIGLDPRRPDEFPEEELQDHLIQPAYDQLPAGFQAPIEATAGDGSTLLLGPYIGAMAEHASKIAIVRGMSMETLTHEVGRRRFLTGKPPSGLQARGSSGGAWLTSALGATDPIGHLAVRVETYNVDQPSYASALTVQSSADLVRTLRAQDPPLPEAQAALVADFLANEARCGRARHSATLRTAEASRLRLGDMLDRNLSKLFDFTTALDTLLPAATSDATVRETMSTLRTHFFGSANPTGLDTTSSLAQAAIAAQALTSRVSRVVSMQAARGLDTHFTNWKTDQGPNQKSGWDALAKLVGYLDSTPYDASTSWLDHTTIVAFSEFMRTPLVNERGGRDHWLCNSCLLVGGNIKPGVVGRSSDVGMQPMQVDLATGRADTSGEVILPEHILRTLMFDAGITEDVDDLRVDPIRALLTT